MQAKRLYSNEEIAGIQRKFNALMARRRRLQRIGFAVFGIVFAVCFALVFLAPRSYTNWIIWLFVVFFAIFGFALAKIHPLLRCLGCKMKLEGSFGNYCPVCGGNPLKLINHRQAHCARCNRQLYYSFKGYRTFKIRACTHCGVTLGRSGF